MSTSTISHVNKTILEQVIFERRVLLACTSMLCVTIVVWVVAIATDHWYLVHGGSGIYIPQSKRYFLESNSGIWRLCRTMLVPTTEAINGTVIVANNGSGMTTAVPQTICKYQDMFPTDEEIKADPSIDSSILSYSRTEASFAIISLLLMCMGFAFSVYTFRNPRYTFKRLAAGCHAITAVSVLAVIEVLCSSIEYERAHLHHTYPPNAYDTYGYSMYLAWFVFLCHLFIAITFLMYSKKRKGSKAPTDELGMIDEPTIIGR